MKAHATNGIPTFSPVQIPTVVQAQGVITRFLKAKIDEEVNESDDNDEDEESEDEEDVRDDMKEMVDTLIKKRAVTLNKKGGDKRTSKECAVKKPGGKRQTERKLKATKETKRVTTEVEEEDKENREKRQTRAKKRTYDDFVVDDEYEELLK